MSDDPQIPDRDYPSAPQALAMQIMPNTLCLRQINHHGDVSIGTLPSWGFKGIMHSNWQNAHAESRHTFRRDFFPRAGGLLQATTFWLKPGALKLRDLDQTEALLNDAVGELSEELGIHPLELRLFVPNENLAETLKGRASIGVVIATDEAHAKYMPQLLARLEKECRIAETREIIAEEKAKAPPPVPESSKAFFDGANSWAQRFSATSDNSLERDGRALRDVMRHHAPLLPLQKVRLQADGFVSFHLPAAEAAILRQTPIPFDFNVSSGRLTKQKQLHDTDGLAIWMTPEFFDPCEIASYARLHPTPEDAHTSLRKRVTLGDIVPQISAMATALSHQFHIPLTATLCRMDPETLPNCSSIAPSAVVLATPQGTTKEGKPYQEILHHQVRAELMRCQYQALREEAQNDSPGQPDRSRPAGR